MMIINLCNLSHSQKLARFVCSFSVAGRLWKGEHKADEVVPDFREASALNEKPRRRWRPGYNATKCGIRRPAHLAVFRGAVEVIWWRHSGVRGGGARRCHDFRLREPLHRAFGSARRRASTAAVGPRSSFWRGRVPSSE
jgi:hypothetical protein